MDKQFAPTTEDSLQSLTTTLNDIRDLLIGIYIQQLRLYDVMTLQMSTINSQKTEELITLHEAGTVLCPEPTLSQND